MVMISIDVREGLAVSGLLHEPNKGPSAVIALAHGAGTDMRHPSLVAVAEGLAGRGFAVLRYNYPYKDRGGRAPDPMPLLQATTRATADLLRARFPGKPLVLAGRSMGGRVSTHVACEAGICEGVIALGYPLTAAGKPERVRSAHLADVKAPMLFVQGTRDTLCDLVTFRPIVAALGERASLHVIEGGDHGFGVLKSSGRTAADVTAEVVDTMVRWVEGVVINAR